VPVLREGRASTVDPADDVFPGHLAADNAADHGGAVARD